MYTLYSKCCGKPVTVAGEDTDQDTGGSEEEEMKYFECTACGKPTDLVNYVERGMEGFY